MGTKREYDEEALKVSEGQYHRLFDPAKDGMLILDAGTGQILDINPYLIDLLGYSLEACLGKYLWEIGSFGDEQAAKLAFAELQDKKYVRYEELPLETSDGRLLTVEFASAVLTVVGRKVIQCFICDITERKQAEEALRRSEALFSTIFHAVPAAISIISLDSGLIINVNNYVIKLTGYERDEIIGRTIVEAPYWVVRDGLKQRILPREEGISSGIEFEWCAKSGQILTMLGSALRIEINGEACQLVIALDITERKQADEALRRSAALFSTIFQSVLVAIDISTVREGRILRVNRHFLETMGYEAEEVNGRTVSELGLWSPSGQRGKFIHELELKGSVRGAEGRWKTKTGEIRDMLISIEPIEVDGEACLLAIANDITERKQLERARLEVYKERELVEVKERFISRMSHEFRTPLAVILSSKESLEYYFDRLTPERRQEKLQQIEEHVRYITALLDDVLLLGKAQAGKMGFQPMPRNLMQLCKTLFEQIQLTDTREHRYTLTVNGALDGVNVDERLLQHILINLLSNAIKYSPEGGEIRLTLSRDGDDAVIQIRDEGIGIPEEDQAHLFEPFQRASNVKLIKGTGLGLAIVKESADAHGGTIICESEVDKGTTFTIRLPTGT